MHLYERQMFIVDEHRQPHYGLALGTGSGARAPALPWVSSQWSPVRECSSFHFGREHFGLVIGPAEGLERKDVHCLVDAAADLTCPADYMSMVTSHGCLVVFATRHVTSSGLAVDYSSWFDGRMRIAMSKYCGPVLWFGTYTISRPPADLIMRIDRYARSKKASSWGPSRIHIINTQEFEECDYDIEPEAWLAEMQVIKLP